MESIKIVIVCIILDVEVSHVHFTGSQAVLSSSRLCRAVGSLLALTATPVLSRYCGYGTANFFLKNGVQNDCVEGLVARGPCNVRTSEVIYMYIHLQSF